MSALKRSEAALEGIALLRGGSVVKKYGRQGKPHETLFKLSGDETVLAWEGHGLKRLKRRAVQVADLEELCVGHESDVFQRLASRETAVAHMSLTLKMASQSERAIKGRETLDLSCDDEETFGLWVAALRALIADRPALLPNDQQRQMLKDLTTTSSLLDDDDEGEEEVGFALAQDASVRIFEEPEPDPAVVRLFRLLRAPGHELALAFCAAASPEDSDKLASALVLVLSSDGRSTAAAANGSGASSGQRRALGFVTELVRTDLEATASKELVFRRNSAATKCATALARRAGGAYLRATLCAPVCVACDAAVGRSHGLEIDPGRLREMKDVDDEMLHALLSSQQAALAHIVQSFVDALLQSEPRVPPPLRALCAEVWRLVLERFGPDADGAARAALSGVLFLRFAVPAIVAPAAHGVLPEPPPVAAARSLVLVSKVITSLANGVELGTKEAFLAPLQPLVADNIEAMQSFLGVLGAQPTAESTAGEGEGGAAEGGGEGGGGEDCGGEDCGGEGCGGGGAEGGGEGGGEDEDRVPNDPALLAALDLVQAVLGRAVASVRASLGEAAASPEMEELLAGVQTEAPATEEGDGRGSVGDMRKPPKSAEDEAALAKEMVSTAL